MEKINENEKYDIEKIREILSFNKRYNEGETLDEQMKKISELYPNCFEDKEFANALADNIRKMDGLSVGRIYKYFDKSVQPELVKKADYYDIGRISPDAIRTIEDGIFDNLSEEDYERLDLSYDNWLDFTAATLYREQFGDNKEIVEGFRISMVGNEYDEDGNPQAFTGPVGIFVPLDNFKDARIDYWDSRYKDAEFLKETVEKLTSVVESIKSLPYANAQELIDIIENEKEIEMEDIEETVSDRTVTDLNKTVEDIQKVEKVEEKEDKKKNKKDIVDDE